MNYMGKVLPAKLQSDVIAFNNYAFPLCVVYGNEMKEEWILEHFGNIYCEDNSSDYVVLDYLEQFDYPKDVLAYSFLEYKDYKQINDIVAHIKERINQEYQIMIIVDNDCLIEKRAHPMRHFPMQIFIYGYEDEQQCFFGMGYKSDYNFGNISYGYDEVNKAFESFKKYYNQPETWVEMYAEIYMKVSFPGEKYKCSKEVILEELSDYYFSNNKEEKIRPEFFTDNKKKFIYGRSAQNLVISALYKLLDNKFTVDFRTIHLLCEQKKMIYKKLKKLADEGFFDNYGDGILKQYRVVCKKMNKARLMFMMQVIEDNGEKQFYAQLKNKDTILRIIKLIEEADKIESEVMERVLRKEK